MANNILDVELKEALENSNCEWKDKKPSEILSEFKRRGYDLEYYAFNILEMRCILCNIIEPVKGKGKKYGIKWKE